MSGSGSDETPADKIARLEAIIQKQKEEDICLFKTFSSCRPPSFAGSTDPVISSNWISEMERTFRACNCKDPQRVLYASFMLNEPALSWWKGVVAATPAEEVERMTWDNFVAKFKKRYITRFDLDKLEHEYHALEKGDKTIDDFTAEYLSKERFVPHLFRDEEDRARKYADKLPSFYSGDVRAAPTLDKAIEIARERERDENKDKAKAKLVATGSSGGGGQKRKFEQSGSSKAASASASSSPTRGGTSAGSSARTPAPWCDICKGYHRGTCPKDSKRCGKCGAYGHINKDCWYEGNVCFRCKKPGHSHTTCSADPNAPKGRPPAGRGRATARAFHMTAEEAKSTGH